MDYKEISKLIKLIDDSNLSEFKLRDGEFSLRIRTDKYTRPTPAGGEPKFISIPQGSPSPEAPQAPAGASMPSTEEAPAEKVQDGGTEAPAENLLQVKSPIVGTFYRSASPDKPPYIKVGDTISEGDVVCIVEAMKLFNEIESEVSGKVVKVMVEDAAPVEYDQVLFLIDPKG